MISKAFRLGAKVLGPFHVRLGLYRTFQSIFGGAERIAQIRLRDFDVHMTSEIALKKSRGFRTHRVACIREDDILNPMPLPYDLVKVDIGGGTRFSQILYR